MRTVIVGGRLPISDPKNFKSDVLNLRFPAGAEHASATPVLSLLPPPPRSELVPGLRALRDGSAEILSQVLGSSADVKSGRRSYESPYEQSPGVGGTRNRQGLPLPRDNMSCKAEAEILAASASHSSCDVTKPVNLGPFIPMIWSTEGFWRPMARSPGRDARGCKLNSNTTHRG